MEKDIAKRQLDREMISPGEYDEAIHFAPDKCEIQIEIDTNNGEASIFSLLIHIRNKHTESLHCSLNQNRNPHYVRKMLNGLHMTAHNGQEAQVTLGSAVFARPRILQSSSTIILPGQQITYKLQGSLGDGYVQFGECSLKFEPKTTYEIRYEYATLVSNTVVWVAPSLHLYNETT